MQRKANCLLAYRVLAFANWLALLLAGSQPLDCRQRKAKSQVLEKQKQQRQKKLPGTSVT